MRRRIAHETTGFLKHAVQAGSGWEFQPGERVLADGLPGEVTAVDDTNPYGIESYTVTLDNGLGGGEYTAAQLTRPGSVTAKFIAADTTEDDDPQPSDALGPVEGASTALASHWYPELGTILTDRLPNERIEVTAGLRLAQAKVHFNPGQGGPACGAGASWDSVQLTTTKGTAKVDCTSCQRTKAYQQAASQRTARQHNDDYQFGFEHGLIGAPGNKPHYERSVAKHGEDWLDDQDRAYLHGHAEGTQEAARREQQRAQTGEHKCPECAGTGMGIWRNGSHCPSCQGTGSISHEDAHQVDVLHHLTDDPNFTPRADYVPTDNALAITQRTQPGLFAAHPDRLSTWTDHYGYERPYVAELHVPRFAHEPGRWGGERFIPAEHIDKVQVARVVPFGQHHEAMGQAGPDYDNLTFHNMTGFEYGAHPDLHEHELLFAVHPEVGYIGRIHYERTPEAIHVHNMTVDPEHQRRGVASQLMAELERRNPDTVIDHGKRTQDGGGWAQSYYGDPGQPSDDLIRGNPTFDSPPTRGGRPVTGAYDPAEAEEASPQPDVCSWCGNPGPWTDEQDTGRGIRIRCGTCGGTMRRNFDEVAGTSSIQWQPEFNNSPQNAASRAGDPRATVNDLRSVRAVFTGQRRKCPCGLEAEFDRQDGWQHLDGSISHDSHGGASVSELMSCPACSGTGEQGTGHECYSCDGTGLASEYDPAVDNANPANGLLVGRNDARGIEPVLGSRLNALATEQAGYAIFTEPELLDAMVQDVLRFHALRWEPRPMLAVLNSFDRIAVATQDLETGRIAKYVEVEGPGTSVQHLAMLSPASLDVVDDQRAFVAEAAAHAYQLANSEHGLPAQSIGASLGIDRVAHLAPPTATVRHALVAEELAQRLSGGTLRAATAAFDHVSIQPDMELGWHFTATWADVRKKATRIRQEGGVRILAASGAGVVGEVQGDTSLYESAFNYVPGTYKVADWDCGCKWGAYAWGRSPAYRRFEGRQCSHVLALQYEAQSRGMFGREVTPDRDRLDGQHPHAPVQVQYQRPTDRHPGGDLTRRTVPPGNMRSEWHPKSRVRVKGSLHEAAAEHDGHVVRQYAVTNPGQPFISGHTNVCDACQYDREGNIPGTGAQAVRHNLPEGARCENPNHARNVREFRDEPYSQYEQYSHDPQVAGWFRPDYRTGDDHVMCRDCAANRHAQGDTTHPDWSAITRQQVDPDDTCKDCGKSLIHEAMRPEAKLAYQYEDTPPTHEWARIFTALGTPPSEVLHALHSLGVPHAAARAAINWATRSDASATMLTDDGAVHRAVAVTGGLVHTASGAQLPVEAVRLVLAAGKQEEATADQGQGEPGADIPGLDKRDQSDAKRKKHHLRHHTNDARMHAPDWGHGLPWGGSYLWCDQCNGSGCGHCGGTGQVLAPQDGSPAPSEASTTNSPQADQGVDAGTAIGGGGLTSTGALPGDHYPHHQHTWWHGSPSGDLRGGSYGLHVGTYDAAKQALEARIGRPADGRPWDGTRAYGETPLAGYSHGYGADAPPEPHLPTGKATYSDGTQVGLDAKPDLFPVRIVGPMTNTPHDPHPDWHANGYMSGQLKRGRARRGYYYANQGEDAGSISAVVPNGDHLQRLPREERTASLHAEDYPVNNFGLASTGTAHHAADERDLMAWHNEHFGPIIVNCAVCGRKTEAADHRNWGSAEIAPKYLCESCHQHGLASEGWLDSTGEPAESTPDTAYAKDWYGQDEPRTELPYTHDRLKPFHPPEHFGDLPSRLNAMQFEDHYGPNLHRISDPHDESFARITDGGLYHPECLDKAHARHDRDLGGDGISYGELRSKLPHGANCDECMQEITEPREHTEEECEHGEDCEYGDEHPTSSMHNDWGSHEDLRTQQIGHAEWQKTLRERGHAEHNLGGDIDAMFAGHPGTHMLQTNPGHPSVYSALQFQADYSVNDFGAGNPAQTYQQVTPHANTPNPGSTGWAASADPSGWEQPIVNSSFGRWESMLHRGFVMTASGDTSGSPTHAGVALKAADTGRVLMIQRSNKDEQDPARGAWEFPGGGREDGDLTSLHTGIREWEEEVGQPFPQGGHVTHVHRSGPYVLHVVNIPEEAGVDFSGGRATVNPDDPDGDDHEQSAWWDVEHARKNPALRQECKSSPWTTIQKAAGVVRDDEDICNNCGQHIRRSSDPNVPWVHSHSQNSFCDVDSPGDATLLAGSPLSRPEAGPVFHEARFLTLDDARAAAGPDPEQALRERLAWQERLFQQTSTLHDEPEPALPSTDGSTDVDDDVATALGYGGEDAEEEPDPGIPVGRVAPWGYPESAADHPDPVVAQPGSADVDMDDPVDEGTLFRTEGSIQAPAGVPPELAQTAAANPAVAGFMQTAGFKALLDGAGSESGGVAVDGVPNDADIAQAAKAALAKTGMKTFSFTEQQELISEGGGKARARNFGDLKIEGTHYAAIKDGDPEVEDDAFFLL